MSRNILRFEGCAHAADGRFFHVQHGRHELLSTRNGLGSFRFSWRARGLVHVKGCSARNCGGSARSRGSLELAGVRLKQTTRLVCRRCGVPEACGARATRDRDTDDARGDPVTGCRIFCKDREVHRHAGCRQVKIVTRSQRRCASGQM